MRKPVRVSGKKLRNCGVTAASVFLLCSGAASAQQTETEVIANAGESYKTASELLLSWTIGEVAIESYTDGNIIVAQGFHQPKVKVTMLAESEGFKNEVSIYPNPAAEFININLNSAFKKEELADVQVELINVAGQRVFKSEFSGLEYSIDLKEIANGSYILQLTSKQNTLIGSYKIEKLK
jgi:hypothetical protein